VDGDADAVVEATIQIGWNKFRQLEPLFSNMDISVIVRGRLGLDDIISVLQQNRLRWYGHMLRKEDNDWVKKCIEYEVEAARPRNRPKKIWREIVIKTVGHIN